MRRKLMATGSIVALVSLMALASTASAGTATSVSIKHQSGGFFGYVHSSKQDPCELNRKVYLYKLKGNGYDPANDKLIGSDIAQPNGPDSMWSINTNASKGDFYAFVHKTSSCGKAYSKVKSL
jgi:hypothetical protein